MEVRKDTYKTEYRSITVRTTDGATFMGKVNIGIKERLSDLFTKPEKPFIILLNGEHEEGAEKVLIINKDHIIWVEPEE